MTIMRISCIKEWSRYPQSRFNKVILLIKQPSRRNVEILRNVRARHPAMRRNQSVAMVGKITAKLLNTLRIDDSVASIDIATSLTLIGVTLLASRGFFEPQAW